MGDSCNTPLDEAESVGNGVRLSISRDPDEDDDEEDDERIDVELESSDASEFEASLLPLELSRLLVELVLTVDPELLRPKLPEADLDNNSSVSEDDNDDDLLLLRPAAVTTSLELELDGSDPDDASTDPLAPAENPADRLAAEPEDESIAGEELEVDPVDPSDADPESDVLADETPEDDPAPSEPDEDPDKAGVVVGAVSLDAESDGGIAVTGGGLIGVDVGVSVGVGDALPESDPGSDEGIAVTGGGLVGLGLGAGVGDGDALLEPELELESDDGIAVTGVGLVGSKDPLDDSDEDTGACVVATGD